MGKIIVLPFLGWRKFFAFYGKENLVHERLGDVFMGERNIFREEEEM